MDKPFAPSCERNRDSILDVLQRHFGDRRHVLEIGCGTGQHAVHFAAAMPWLQWQCSDAEPVLGGTRQWLAEAALPNTPAPIPMQAVEGRGFVPAPLLPHQPAGRPGFDAVFTANTLHIMGWDQVQALFGALPTVLAADACVVAYGPFNKDGRYTSESNREFDAWLRARDPLSGIRDCEAVDTLARGAGLQLVEDVDMPANNRCLVWHRRSA